jgi:hypothetical protein
VDIHDGVDRKSSEAEVFDSESTAILRTGDPRTLGFVGGYLTKAAIFVQELDDEDGLALRRGEKLDLRCSLAAQREQSPGCAAELQGIFCSIEDEQGIFRHCEIHLRRVFGVQLRFEMQGSFPYLSIMDHPRKSRNSWQ